jgi:acetyltransferase-like isoleucine patch superfamily enzyme
VTFLALYRGALRARARAFSLLAARSFAGFGAGSVVEPPVRIAGESRIAIGDGVYVGAGSWLQALPGDGIALEIGDGTSISGTLVVSAARSVRIGRSVLMARNVYLSDHGHAFERAGTPVLAQGVTEPRPVEIGDGAWLGENVVVCPGVRIGRGAVVGANAVVLEDVPDWSVAVGVPARVVRSFAGSEALAAR